MKDRLEKSLRDRLRAGARPWRADPRYARPIVLTVAQAIKVAILLIIAGCVLTVSGYALLGLHPATSADLRLASIVRAALPDADAMSQDDLVARLAVPRALGETLAPLAATDPARDSVVRHGWLDALQDGPPAVTTPERMRTLGEIASALAALPSRDRTDAILAFIGLYRATRDPASRTIIADVGALSRPQREALAGSDALTPLLAAIADLPQSKQQALADGRLELLPDDPDRLRLLQSIPRLDLTAVRLVNRLADITDFRLRQALIYVVAQISFGSPNVLRLLEAYYCHESSLMAALTLPSPGICRRPQNDR